MTTFQAFDSDADYQKALTDAIEAADSNVDIYQQSLQAGAYYIADNGDFIAYGQALDAVAMSTCEAEKRYLRELYDAPQMVNYRYSRAFSPMCPEGELGDMHVSTVMMKISAAQFEAAKEAGFPQEEDEVKTLLNIQNGGIA